MKSFEGRLSKGAGTHLASWLQETRALSAEEGQALLDATGDHVGHPLAHTQAEARHE